MRKAGFDFQFYIVATRQGIKAILDLLACLALPDGLLPLSGLWPSLVSPWCPSSLSILGPRFISNLWSKAVLTQYHITFNSDELALCRMLSHLNLVSCKMLTQPSIVQLAGKGLSLQFLMTGTAQICQLGFSAVHLMSVTMFYHRHITWSLM